MSEYFNQIIDGVKSFITGMRLTLNHFNKKKDLVATLQYPHEKWPVPERDIGFDHADYNLIRSRLHVDIDDCIACMQCERACPVDCIKIDSIKPPKDNDFDCGMTSNDTQKKMIVSRFTIDMSECMYCNLCVYPCPEECIYMVGGPNDKKHEIDYEFSQYERDGMVFEFADATDEDIKNAGGEKWLEKRDIQHASIDEGLDLKGYVEASVPIQKESALETEIKKPKESKASPKITSGELEIASFNEISDKMCRGVAKKIFTASKRAGKDKAGILADIAQSLSDYGKLTTEIKSIIDALSITDMSNAVEEEGISIDSNESNDSSETEIVDIKELEIKDLNVIEDKMVRGTAKKAFTAAKRSGEDKVVAIKKALSDNSLLNDEIDKLLNSFNKGDSMDTVDSGNIVKNDQVDNELDSVKKSDYAKLFEITDLNKIEDRMARGIAKKSYTASKRAKHSSSEALNGIKNALEGAGKLDDAIIKILKSLGDL